MEDQKEMYEAMCRVTKKMYIMCEALQEETEEK